MEKKSDYKLLAILLSVIVILLSVFACLFSYNSKSKVKKVDEPVVTKTEIERITDIINGTPTASYNGIVDKGGVAEISLYENNVFWIRSGNGTTYDNYIGTYTIEGDEMIIERKYEAKYTAPRTAELIDADLDTYKIPVTETCKYSEKAIIIKDYLKGSEASYAGMKLVLSKEK